MEKLVVSTCLEIKIAFRDNFRDNFQDNFFLRNRAPAYTQPSFLFPRYFDAEDLSKPSQCFLFRSCGRSVERASADCVLNEENTIEVKPFVKSDGDCKSLCQQVTD